MDKQSYSVELMLATPEQLKFYEENILHHLVETLITLEMVSLEQFIGQEELFIDVLKELFRLKFVDRKKTFFRGKYHPPKENVGHHYDLGLRLDDSDDHTYCFRIELIGIPTDTTVVH